MRRQVSTCRHLGHKVDVHYCTATCMIHHTCDSTYVYLPCSPLAPRVFRNPPSPLSSFLPSNAFSKNKSVYVLLQNPGERSHCTPCYTHCASLRTLRPREVRSSARKHTHTLLHTCNAHVRRVRKCIHEMETLMNGLKGRLVKTTSDVKNNDI